VLQLVAEGRLRLDDTLKRYLPGVVPKGDKITIRQLLNHRSGLWNITDHTLWLDRARRSSSTRPIDTLRFAASRARNARSALSKGPVHGNGSVHG
jgi:CubicO group peptidase (beta-lactamase class C family)